MTSMQDIRRRIKSVKSTQKITRVMKMVSASKLRRIQNNLNIALPYSERIAGILNHFLTNDIEIKNSYIKGHKIVKKACYIVVSADDGLCGGYNNNLNKFAFTSVKAEDLPYKLLILGSKAKEYFEHRHLFADESFVDWGDNPSFFQAKQLALIAMDMFDKGEVDKVYLIYTQFISGLSQVPVCQQILPVVPTLGGECFTRMVEYIFEPNKEELLAGFVPQYIEVVVYRALLEAKASEQRARMTAMSAATDNADDIIDNLTLTLNRVRQAAITTEISEIVSGAAALS